MHYYMMGDKMNKHNLCNKIFLVLLLLIACGILFKLTANSNQYNYADNRTAIKFTIPSINKLLSGKYQENVETAIADQMPKYYLFKTTYLKIANYIDIITIKLLKLDKKDKYIKIGNINIYKGYLLYDTTTDEKLISTTEEDIIEINKLNNNTKANVYVYFIDSDSNFNFETNYKVDATKYLKSKLNIGDENIANYNISSFNDYKDYFYKTDHHWNHHGSYNGYKEIATMMHFDNIIKPIDEICYDKPSYGTKTKRLVGIKTYYDQACIYTFNFPKFEIYADGKLIDEYGTPTDEISDLEDITYGNIYGADYKEMVIINKEVNNNKKLLIYANSYSNAIDKLLASEYQYTYVIDGRYYKNKRMIDYVNEKGIEDVVILANCMLFGDEITW